MKNIFPDTNFFIDYFVRDGYNEDAKKVLQLGDE